MHRLSSSFVLGYHGCTRAVGEQLLAGTPFRKSDNDYDWLGPGAYFWEANPQRALDWALATHGEDEAFAVGAVLDLGFCLDLTTTSGCEAVLSAHDRLAALMQLANVAMPQNRGGADLRNRKLDCAVIRLLHEMNAEAHQPPIDSVKGVFVEGGELYPGAGFRALTHIQVAICNLDCIKAAAWPRRSLLFDRGLTSSACGCDETPYT